MQPAPVGLPHKPSGQVQAVPSQCSRTADPPADKNPTAQALESEAALTPVSIPAAGLGTSRQSRPFQCSITVRRPPRPAHSVPPTAQALPGESAVTPCSWPNCPRDGLGVSAQAWPSQCSMSAPPDASVPTAQAFAGAVAATPANVAPRGIAGLG